MNPISRMLTLSLVMGIIALIGACAGPSAWAQQETAEAPTAPNPADSTAESDLLAKMLRNNRSREQRLQRYSETRNYAVQNDKGKMLARMMVQMHYSAPSEKSFATLCEEGSGTVRRLVFNKLMESEVEAAAGRSHRDSSITAVNYNFHLLGVEDSDGRRYFVVEAIPTRKDKYLFEGRIWIDSQDFAIAKIAGHPARNPSFWITRVDFVRKYQKIGDFWFPLEDESTTHLKLFGTKILTIEHFDYLVNQPETREQSPNPNSGGCQATQAAQLSQ